MTPPRRRVLVALAVVVAVVGAAVWAIPSFGGRLFVDVAARVGPAGADAGGRSVVLPDGSVSPSPRLRVEVAITNRYPMPVVLEFRGSAIHAKLVARDRPDEAAPWQSSGDDPSLETGDDSPDTSSARVVVVQPGTTTLPSSAAPITFDAASTDIAAGIYALHVSAFGLDAAPALISIIDGGS
jgi:hypothetical protein